MGGGGIAHLVQPHGSHQLQTYVHEPPLKVNVGLYRFQKGVLEISMLVVIKNSLLFSTFSVYVYFTFALLSSKLHKCRPV